jgi:hypothetical protein
MNTETTVEMKPYLLQFVGVYALCIVAIYLITTLLNFDAPSSMGMATLIAATAPVMQSFVNKEQRVPTRSERANFATLATVATLVIGVLIVILWSTVFQTNPLELLNATDTIGAGLGGGSILSAGFMVIALAAMAIAAVLSWVVVYFFSGFMANQTLKQIEKAKLK